MSLIAADQFASFPSHAPAAVSVTVYAPVFCETKASASADALRPLIDPTSATAIPDASVADNPDDPASTDATLPET